MLPQVRHELAHWRRRAEQIPNAQLRHSAQLALAERGNIEGAALFATLAPAANRGATVRPAPVAFQSAYNYLDALSEQAQSDQPAAPTASNCTRACSAALHRRAPLTSTTTPSTTCEADDGYLLSSSRPAGAPSSACLRSRRSPRPRP